MPSEDFSIIPSYSEVDFFEVDAGLLSTMIDQTAFSMCTDTTRPNLNGALFQLENSVMRIVTTDGHRLSKSEYSVECLCDDFSITIPYKAMVEIKHMAKSNKNMSFGMKDSLVFFRTQKKNSETVFSSKLIEDDYPPYRNVIPVLSDEFVVVSRQELINSLKRLIVISDNNTFGIKLEISNGVLNIKANNFAIGKGVDSVDVSYSGELLSAGLDARYFLDVLNALKDDEIRIRITDKFGFDAFVINGIDDSFVGLIMPMRID
jgi:DNA polymerase-3 subunit beta